MNSTMQLQEFHAQLQFGECYIAYHQSYSLSDLLLHFLIHLPLLVYHSQWTQHMLDN